MDAAGGLRDEPAGEGRVELPRGREEGTEESGLAIGARPRAVAGSGHRLVRTGAILWCHRCGAHAEARVGSALAGVCRPVAEGEKSGRASRRRLLLKGRHPINRQPLDGAHGVGEEVHNTEAFEEQVVE